MIRVVNKKTHQPTKSDFPVHRGTILGNPWTHHKFKTKALYVCATRAESIAKYKEWFETQIAEKNEKVLDELRRIWRMAKAGDVNLVCYCVPDDCHAYIIQTFIESHGRPTKT